MKTAPHPEHDEEGYKGSLAETGNLSAAEKREVRRVLCSPSAPLHLSALGQQARIQMTNPSKVSALGTYLEKTLQTLGEAEMVFEDRLPSATGKARPGKLFCGWRGTPRLQGAIEKGLA